MRQTKIAFRRCVTPLLRVWAAFVLAVYLLPCPALAGDLFMPAMPSTAVVDGTSSPHGDDTCCQGKGGVLHNDACCQHAIAAHSGTPQLSQQGFHARSLVFALAVSTAILGLWPRVVRNRVAGRKLASPLPVKPVPPNLRLLI